MTLVRHALVVGNGEPPSKQLFDELMADNPVLLCADGGADTATGYGYRRICRRCCGRRSSWESPRRCWWE